MEINSNGYLNANNTTLENTNPYQEASLQTTEEELTVEEQINKSAVEVSLSMNAQIILFAMDSQDLATNNTSAQSSIFDLLSGKEVEGELSLKDIGYEGKPITELSEEEASELISEEGFFGISQTSQRVADFVFGFAGDDLDILEQGREGIVKGFEEAQEMWGGELPQISYDTQARTLELIDARIAELNGTSNSNLTEEDVTIN
ncbi:hydrogenase-4 component G [Arcobacteraceae bacterium]|nr:hydrogenase-4 component G [Arcobacteraceae bacterium]